MRIEKSGDVLEAMRRNDAIVRTYAALADVAAARQKADELRASPAVARALREEAHASEFERTATQRMVHALKQFSMNDEELTPTLFHELDIPRLKKIAAGAGYDAAAARRVLGLIRFQLRDLANDLEQHGRSPRAQQVRSIASQAQP